jgi:hypothetical protein
MSPKRPEAAAESKISLHPIHRVNLLYFYSIAPPLSMRCGLFSESALFIFLLTAERKIIINCAYTHIAVCYPPCENCLERENRAVGPRQQRAAARTITIITTITSLHVI